MTNFLTPGKCTGRTAVLIMVYIVFSPDGKSKQKTPSKPLFLKKIYGFRPLSSGVRKRTAETNTDGIQSPAAGMSRQTNPPAKELRRSAGRKRQRRGPLGPRRAVVPGFSRKPRSVFPLCHRAPADINLPGHPDCESFRSSRSFFNLSLNSMNPQPSRFRKTVFRTCCSANNIQYTEESRAFQAFFRAKAVTFALPAG